MSIWENIGESICLDGKTLESLYVLMGRHWGESILIMSIWEDIVVIKFINAVWVQPGNLSVWK